MLRNDFNDADIDAIEIWLIEIEIVYIQIHSGREQTEYVVILSKYEHILLTVSRIKFSYVCFMYYICIDRD